jgi:16S rRNA (adenine1518-N6/adenine1519-N6)-dimethyltransferase
VDRPPFKKRLGQHHLHDSALCRPLVEYLEPAGGRVIEIGPGGGVLTEALLEAGATVMAWELDPAWTFETARRLASEPRLRLVNADALALPWERIKSPFKVAGNLPYNVATALIDRMLDQGPRIARAAFMVQLEVAQRLAAGPGSKAYGAASVLTAARAKARILARVEPGSFFPPPKVVSAFIGLEPRRVVPTLSAFGELRTLVFAAFGQRRKTLRNALSTRWPRAQVQSAIARVGLEPDVRAEQLSCAEFGELLNQLREV